LSTLLKIIYYLQILLTRAVNVTVTTAMSGIETSSGRPVANQRIDTIHLFIHLFVQSFLAAYFQRYCCWMKWCCYCVRCFCYWRCRRRWRC